MKQNLESLLEFQKAEIEIDRLNSNLNSVPGRLADLDNKQESLQTTYENEKNSLAVLKKKYRSMESEVQTNIAKISKSQEKLGSVKTNKEYQAILKEIDDIKGKNSAIEDEMIDCLEQMETVERELTEKSGILKQILANLTAEKDTINREAEENAKRLDAAEQLRRQLAEDVDTALMADYDRVKKIVRTRPVVPVLKAICQGCHLNIPPQMFNELQRGDQLKFCPHCDRIVFWNDMLE